MKKGLVSGLAIGFMVFGSATISQAVVIDFTGGTAQLLSGGTLITNNSVTSNWNDVDYYEEDGFKLDFIGDGGIIGNYYGLANDVIHGHWATGGYGSLTEIKVSKIDGATFDVNYFELTSNTDTGGSNASGAELAYLTGYNADGTPTGTQVLLPPDDWGWAGPNPQIFLGSVFDNVAWFSFTVGNAVDCFGMDSFYINEPAPPPNDPVPEPATMLLFGTGIAAVAGVRRRKKD